MSCIGENFLNAFSLRVQPLGETKDDTAVNNIKFTCTSGEQLEGIGMIHGAWGNFSSSCSKGICGIETRVQNSQGPLGDDTALNDVRFLCC